MKTLCWPSLLPAALSGLGLGILAVGVLVSPAAAHAIEIKVSAQALERTLNIQLFSGPDGRYYFRALLTTRYSLFLAPAYGEMPAVAAVGGFAQDGLVLAQLA